MSKLLLLAACSRSLVLLQRFTRAVPSSYYLRTCAYVHITLWWTDFEKGQNFTAQSRLCLSTRLLSSSWLILTTGH